MKKRILVLLVFAFTSLWVGAGEGENWVKLRDRIRMLRHDLALQGAYAFVTNEATPHWINQKLGLVDIGRSVIDICRGGFLDYGTYEFAREQRGMRMRQDTTGTR